MSEQEEQEKFVLVPRNALSSEALEGLVDEYILREGTDYGHGDKTMEQKRQSLFKQLDAKSVCIVFSTATENCTLMTANDLRGIATQELEA